MKRFFAALSALLLWSSVQAADLIPAANLQDWDPGTSTGVPGGIPTTYTQYVNAITAGIDNTGATDQRAAIQVLLDACPADQYVYFPAGTYRIDGTIFLNNSETLIRGAGATTIFDARGSIGIVVGPQNSNLASVTATTSSEFVRGGTSLTLSSASGFATNDLMTISPANIPSVPVVSVAGYENVAIQVVRVTGVVGDVVSFSPGLFDDMGAGSVVVSVSKANGKIRFSGVEDIRVTGLSTSNLQTGIRVSNGYGCWVSGCTIDATTNYGIELFNSLQTEARTNRVDTRKTGSGSNGGGITMAYASNLLVENNIVVGYFPALEVNFGTSGSAISRNYFGDFNANTNHAPHNRYNLYEANVAKGGILDDGYFGGSRYQTYYNNKAIYIVLKRMAYDAAIVMNVISDASTLQQYGYPNISNSDYSGGTVNPPSTLWADWGMTATLTTRTDDDNGVITLGSGFALSTTPQATVDLWWDSGGTVQRFDIGTNTSGTSWTIGPVNPFAPNINPLPEESTVFTRVGPGSNGYQELDLGVSNRLTKKGNRFGDNVFDSLDGATPPASLMYDSKPAWITAEEVTLSTTFNLQAFDPVTPVAASDSDIPAGYRYLFLTPPVHQGATINSAGTELAVTMSKPVVVGAGGSGGFSIGGGVTLTYDRISGSSVILTTSRVITDAETYTLTYANPGNGIEDANGNDLASFTLFPVANASQITAGAYWLQAIDLAATNSTTKMSNIASVSQPIAIPGSGLVTKVRIGIAAGAYATVDGKVALLDENNVVLSTGTKEFTASEDYEVFDIEPISVVAGVYQVAVIADSNNEPPLAIVTGQPSNTSSYAFAASYAGWPVSPVTPDGNSSVRYAFGILFAADTIVSQATVSGTTTVTGTLTLP